MEPDPPSLPLRGSGLAAEVRRQIRSSRREIRAGADTDGVLLTRHFPLPRLKPAGGARGIVPAPAAPFQLVAASSSSLVLE